MSENEERDVGFICCNFERKNLVNLENMMNVGAIKFIKEKIYLDNVLLKLGNEKERLTKDFEKQFEKLIVLDNDRVFVEQKVI